MASIITRQQRPITNSGFHYLLILTSLFSLRGIPRSEWGWLWLCPFFLVAVVVGRHNGSLAQLSKAGLHHFVFRATFGLPLLILSALQIHTSTHMFQAFGAALVGIWVVYLAPIFFLQFEGP